LAPSETSHFAELPPKVNGSLSKDEVDLERFRPGDLIRWLNDYQQWQNATIIEFNAAMERYKITEDKNLRTRLCSPSRTHKRHDCEGKPCPEQF
jgi:hypothetical protein